jgi:hypothetical protein
MISMTDDGGTMHLLPIVSKTICEQNTDQNNANTYKKVTLKRDIEKEKKKKDAIEKIRDNRTLFVRELCRTVIVVQTV